MSNIDFNKIIQKHASKEYAELLPESCEKIKAMMREACIQVLDEAAERARVRTNNESTSIIVDKQSILEIKEEL